MGVLSCARNGCPNVMCDIYVSGVGYICYSCQEEYRMYAVEDLSQPTSECQIKESLQRFMETPKDSYRNTNNITIDEFFTKYTI